MAAESSYNGISFQTETLQASNCPRKSCCRSCYHKKLHCKSFLQKDFGCFKSSNRHGHMSCALYFSSPTCSHKNLALITCFFLYLSFHECRETILFFWVFSLQNISGGKKKHRNIRTSHSIRKCDSIHSCRQLRFILYLSHSNLLCCLNKTNTRTNIHWRK